MFSQGSHAMPGWSRRFTTVAYAIVLSAAAIAEPTPAAAQAGARRCPTCAPAPDPATAAARRGASSGGIARRGAPGAAPQPMTVVSVTVGSTHFAGSVDAECEVDPRATRQNTRFYYRAMYPWFGQRVAPDKPQWRVSVEVRPASKPDAYDQFVFSFQDGPKGGVIQNVSFGQRIGSGTVRVTRHGAGARFDVAGRTDRGEAVRATIDCSQFQGGEAAGG